MLQLLLLGDRFDLRMRFAQVVDIGLSSINTVFHKSTGEFDVFKRVRGSKIRPYNNQGLLIRAAAL